jgi:CRP/FNR family transcriptional regulator, cyclic AMP receptor protein
MQVNVASLEAQPFLRGMTERQLELLANESMPAEFRTDEVIISEGAPANRFYLILEGRVELEAPVLEGEAIHIQTLGAGDVLGWSWLFPPYYWHFNARASTPVKAIFFYGTRLRELCEENHDFGYALMLRVSEIVIKRLQATRLQLLEKSKTLLTPI